MLRRQRLVRGVFRTEHGLLSLILGQGMQLLQPLALAESMMLFDHVAGKVVTRKHLRVVIGLSEFEPAVRLS